jgi:enolase-phosphatase E1
MIERGPAPAMLVDIEGTTTPITFVYDVLFPYARHQVRGFLERRGREPEVRADLEALRHEHATDLQAADRPPPWLDSEDPDEGAVAYVHWLMDRDRKSTGLKALQGRLWEEGFREGVLRSDVYGDVLPAFRRWHAGGQGPWIFSSGSVLAQKLLFGHTRAGDLTPLIRGYFDTTTGPKKEAGTYARIAAEMARPPARVLFASDVPAELDAARGAGLQTAWCVRDGDPPAPSAHRVIHTFDELS